MRILCWLQIAFVFQALRALHIGQGGMLGNPSSECFVNSVLSATGSSHGPLEQFWEDALKVQEYAVKAGKTVLEKAVKFADSSAQAVQNFETVMTDVVNHTKTIRDDVQSYMNNTVDLSYLSNTLSDELGMVYEDFKNEVTDPLPEDRSERSQARAQLIKHVMEKIRPAYVRAMVKVGVPDWKAESDFDGLSQKLTHLLLITGNIIDDHPLLLDSMLFAASMFLLPEIQILRPIFSVFGFGPTGPVKGTAAAWAQRRFYGAAVKSGSWFAILQKVSMTLVGSWWQRILASTGLAAALGLTIRRCSNPRL